MRSNRVMSKRAKKTDGFVFTVAEEKGDEVIIEISEADYLREKAAGVKEEFLLKPGRHKFLRGGFWKRHQDLVLKEGFFDVTEADYQEQLAEGIEEEFLIKPGRYKYFRGRHPRFQPGDLEPRNTTVHITLPVALDVVKYFERRAAELQADSFKTLMAETLRQALPPANGAPPPAAYETLLNDERFIAAVAARVKTFAATPKAAARKRKRPAKAKAA